MGKTACRLPVVRCLTCEKRKNAHRSVPTRYTNGSMRITTVRVAQSTVDRRVTPFFYGFTYCWKQSVFEVQWLHTRSPRRKSRRMTNNTRHAAHDAPRMSGRWVGTPVANSAYRRFLHGHYFWSEPPLSKRYANDLVPFPWISNRRSSLCSYLYSYHPQIDSSIGVIVLENNGCTSRRRAKTYNIIRVVVLSAALDNIITSKRTYNKW